MVVVAEAELHDSGIVRPQVACHQKPGDHDDHDDHDYHHYDECLGTQLTLYQSYQLFHFSALGCCNEPGQRSNIFQSLD